MANYCSAALGFDGVTHRDSDDKSPDNARSGINGRCSHAKDGPGGVAHGVSNIKIIDGTNVGENDSHQDDIVVP
jgi:hypothetical protein